MDILNIDSSIYIFQNYFSIKDSCKINIAFCNKKYSNYIKSIYSSDYYVNNARHVIEYDRSTIICIYEWFAKNKIKFNTISNGCTFEKEYHYSGSKITRVIFYAMLPSEIKYNRDFTDHIATMIANNCPSLTILEF